MAWKFRFAQPCEACLKDTHDVCDACGKAFCGHGACLFETGETLTFPPDPQDEYPDEYRRPEELCLVCYLAREGHPPYSIWAETAMHSTLSFRMLQPGAIMPVGDAHSWYSPPSAGKLLSLKFGDRIIELDTFQVVQLMNFLQAHDQTIKDLAKATSEVLIAESHERTDAALRADAGIVDYSLYE